MGEDNWLDVSVPSILDVVVCEGVCRCDVVLDCVSDTRCVGDSVIVQA